jgi:hypothetical protein
VWDRRVASAKLCDMGDTRGGGGPPIAEDSDPWTAVNVMRDQVARAAQVRERLATLVGSAASEDGLLKAKVGPEGFWTGW